MIKPVPLDKFYRLINHGATTLISAKHKGVENVMSASWVCPLDYSPNAKLTVVLDKSAYTRTLVEQSGLFAVQIPMVKQVDVVMAMGQSRKDNPHKIDNIPLFYQENFDVPLVAGCAGWIVCRLIRNLDNEQNHDLFIGEVLSAWADSRIFDNGRWKFDEMGDEWRTLHYIAGGQFYAIGESLVAE
ncbi:flavin reductase family protein [Moraxella cuniculi]|uniref:Flavin reductase like domain n=1 Tax=Moraxella cuniculi TaxID=34061 RepID=A0A3S4R5S1_9GAMM|nr:flavin reductase family protein [Moraxella cuniculi]VEG13460.1 Flavin reductase like domain [Moraxella cuniculi]